MVISEARIVFEEQAAALSKDGLKIQSFVMKTGWI